MVILIFNDLVFLLFSNNVFRWWLKSSNIVIFNVIMGNIIYVYYILVCVKFFIN